MQSSTKKNVNEFIKVNKDIKIWNKIQT